MGSRWITLLLFGWPPYAMLVMQTTFPDANVEKLKKFRRRLANDVSIPTNQLWFIFSSGLILKLGKIPYCV